MAGPKVGQRATREGLPNTPTQPSVAKTPSASTGPAPTNDPPKAGPPKAAADLSNPNESQKAANPGRASVHDIACDA